MFFIAFGALRFGAFLGLTYLFDSPTFGVLLYEAAFNLFCHFRLALLAGTIEWVAAKEEILRLVKVYPLPYRIFGAIWGLGLGLGLAGIFWLLTKLPFFSFSPIVLWYAAGYFLYVDFLNKGIGRLIYWTQPHLF